MWFKPNVEKLKSRNDVETLLKLLDRASVQDDVIATLGELGDPRALVPLIKLLDRDLLGTWSFSGASICDALGKLRDRRAVPSLLSALLNGGTRESAVKALGAIGDNTAVPQLLSLLQSRIVNGDARERDYPLVRAITKALWSIGDDSAIPVLQQILYQAESVDSETRRIYAYLVCSLALLGDRGNAVHALEYIACLDEQDAATLERYFVGEGYDEAQVLDAKEGFFIAEVLEAAPQDYIERMREFQKLRRDLRGCVDRIPSVARRVVGFVFSRYLSGECYYPEYDHGVRGEWMEAFRLGYVEKNYRLNTKHPHIVPILQLVELFDKWALSTDDDFFAWFHKLPEPGSYGCRGPGSRKFYLSERWYIAKIWSGHTWAAW